MSAKPARKGGMRLGASEYRQIAERMKAIQEQQRRVIRNMNRIKYKVAVLSSKGGVGKSFVTATLAAAIALKGRRVGVFDADFGGPSIHKMVGLPTGYGMQARMDGSIIPPEVPPGVKVASVGLLLPRDEVPLIWRGSIKTSAIRELLAYVDWGELDYLLIDMPPGTGDEQLTITQIIPKLTGFILVTIPSEVSKAVVKKAASFAKRVGVPVVGVIENMAYFKCNDGSVHYIFGRGAAREIAEEYKIPYLGEVPIDPRIREANDRGKVFFLEYPESEASKAFTSIAEKVIDIIESGKAIVPPGGVDLDNL
ncbi:MAG: Mrp/NBP35 family ATP-binding protein [Desulfurococcales archaeon]|nr:Mrp/NBP35 family ATP-binding protein [Desulfurococcales archaeon]